jgi:hypothetical protein
MDNQLFYIVEPSQLTFSAAGMSLQERRDRLRELVRTCGAEWAAIRMRGAEFMAAVEELDRYLRAHEELTNSAFENSPERVLPVGYSGEYNPLFGYYEPDRVREFDEQLRAIPASVIERWEAGPNGDAMGQVVHAFRITFSEAAKRKRAIAVEHN